MSYNPDRANEKWVKGMTGAGESYKQGIQDTKVNPMEKAAAMDEKYLRKVQESVTSGKRAKGLARVPFSKWKELAASKGAARLGTGAQAAKDKTRAFHAEWSRHLTDLESKLALVPKTDDAAAKERMNINFDHAKTFKRS